MRYTRFLQDLPCVVNDPCNPLNTCANHQADTFHVCIKCGARYVAGEYLEKHIARFENPRRILDVVLKLMSIYKEYGNIIVAGDDHGIPTLEVSKDMGDIVTLIPIDEIFENEHVILEEKFAVML